MNCRQNEWVRSDPIPGVLRATALPLALVMLATFVTATPSAYAQTLECATISMGGGMTSNGSIGIIGQPVAGTITGAGFTIEVGGVSCIASASAPVGCGACQLHGDVFPFTDGDPNGNPVGNCVVDIDDILTVLSAFSDADPCTGFPEGVNTFPCDELCTAGTVDIDDILSGLAAFSGTYGCAHPCPGGACCFGDSTCQDWDAIAPGTTPTGGMSQSTCGTAGGNYQGDGTTCDDVSCP